MCECRIDRLDTSLRIGHHNAFGRRLEHSGIHPVLVFSLPVITDLFPQF